MKSLTQRKISSNGIIGDAGILRKGVEVKWFIPNGYDLRVMQSLVVLSLSMHRSDSIVLVKQSLPFRVFDKIIVIYNDDDDDDDNDHDHEIDNNNSVCKLNTLDTCFCTDSFDGPHEVVQYINNLCNNYC
jgi:hypothetical protein